MTSSSPRPVFSTFDRSAMPSNLLTVAEWRRFASVVGSSSWQAAARRYAQSQGGALVLRADDSLVVFTRLQSGKIRRQTYKPQAWGWAA